MTAWAVDVDGVQRGGAGEGDRAVSRVVAIIPARLGSTRLPEKVLADILGRPMLVWVAEAARRARRVDAVYVATGDAAVVSACEQWGLSVLRTPASLPSGTDRVAMAADAVEADVIINVQGDEPTLAPAALDALVDVFAAPTVELASLMTALAPSEIEDPHRVKVWCDAAGDASRFSRVHGGRPGARLHVGVYAFRPDRLRAFAALEPCEQESRQRLEQLRALEQGWPIRMVETPWRGLSVDTPADLVRVRRVLGDAGAATSTQVSAGGGR